MIASIRRDYEGYEWWSQVSWRGWVDHPDQFLSSLDLLLCPSSDFDPLPTVMLEAGRAGTPVLAARQGGAPEIVSNGESGWLFDPEDVQGASRLLEALVGDRARLQAAGRVAADRVRCGFSVERMCRDYDDLYREVTSRRQLLHPSVM